MKKNQWKSREGIVFSTNDDFEYDYGQSAEEETLPNEKQKMKIKLDTKARKGKKVTVVSGFVGSSDDLKLLEKALKNTCGVGGSSKDGEVLIQGDVRQKVYDYLTKQNYNAKII